MGNGEGGNDYAERMRRNWEGPHFESQEFSGLPAAEPVYRQREIEDLNQPGNKGI